MDKTDRNNQLHLHVLKNIDFSVRKINEATKHVESFALRNDEKMNIVLKYRDHMLNIFTHQKKMNTTLEDILEDPSVGLSFPGPVAAGPVSGRRGLWDSPDPEIAEVGVTVSEGAAGPEVTMGQEDLTPPEKVVAPEEVAAPTLAEVTAPEDTPPNLPPAEDSVAKPNVTITSPTPINSQDEAQDTTTLVAAPQPPPTSNPSETDVVTRQLSPLPTDSTSPASRLAPPPPIIEKKNSKRSRDNTPTLGDRRSPRISSNSRAPTPPKIGPPKRQSNAKGGGDLKHQKLNPL